MEEIVLIPAFQPDEKLIALVDELWENGFGILVVNDGSDSVFDHIFKKVAKRAEILHLKKNGGKGNALKMGMVHIKYHHPECNFFVTADADGQHRVHDIIRVREEMRRGAGFVLSVREFSGKIPFRSRFGNDLSRVIYTELTGHYFKDNQSGLRGFDVSNIDWLLKVPGDKYDYELNMLYYADKQGLTITTMTIDTVYIDGNKSSHFDPLKDTLRLYKLLFSSAWVSIVCAAMCQLMMILITLTLEVKFAYVTVTLAGAVCAMVNVLLNKYAAFAHIKYADGGKTVAFHLLRFILYSWVVYAFGYLLKGVPIILIFDVVVLIGAVPRYFIHKWLHGFKGREIVKENR